MIDKKSNFMFSALYSTSSGVNQSGDEQEQYPKALGHTVEELDVSEAGIISYHIISRYSLWGWDNQGSSCSQEHLGSMSMYV